MARPITAAGNRANRRLLLLGLAAGIVAAILVYATISRGSESNGGAGSAASMVPAVVAKQDIPARTKVTTDMVEVRQVPTDAHSELAYTDLSQVVGQITRYPVATGEEVLSTKVVSLQSVATTGDSLSYIIPEGRRGISIQVNEVTSSGGLVLPGDYVDVIGVFDVTFGTGDQQTVKDKYFSRMILQNIEVLAVAQTVVDTAPAAGTTGSATPTTGTEDAQRVRNTDVAPEPTASTVTLSVTPQEAQLLFLAEENGILRLALRPYGDSNVQDIPIVAEAELIPTNLPPPAVR